MLRIKKNDIVAIVAGKDKGKTGKVLRVLPKSSRVIVENINVVKKAQRRTRQDQQAGFVSIESPMHISNVMLLDKQSNKGTRFSVSVLKDRSKVRTTKKGGASI